MDKFDVIQPHLLPIVLIILGAIIINVTLIALVVGYIKIRMRGIMKEGRNNGKFVVKSSLWDFFISLCLSDWDDDSSSFPSDHDPPLSCYGLNHWISKADRDFL